MRLHVAALPHTDVVAADEWCAYTGKLLRLGTMLATYGHDAIYYCGDRSDATGGRVAVVSADDRTRWFGGPWDRTVVFDRWEPTDPCWADMNAAAAAAILDRWEPGDVVGLIAGRCQEAIVRAVRAVHPTATAVEWGVGYEGIVLDTPTLCAFETSAWRHYVYGKWRIGLGRHFDAVVPNAYDPDDFTVDDDGGYLLFLGRHIPQKGTAVVAALAARGHRVVTAGQGGPIDGCEYRGVVTGAAKRDLLAGATAVVVPTIYVEPFGGVAVEAQLSGVPAITTDFGAFTETVVDGETGYRCNTLGDFERAAAAAPYLRGDAVRARAAARYSLAAVAGRYDEWLRRVALLDGDGWYATTP